MQLLKAALICSLLCLAACGNKSSDDSPPKIESYVIKGDPDLIVAGSQMNSSSPFNEDNIQALSDYGIFKMVGFGQKEKPQAPASQADIEKQNAPSSGDTKQASYDLKVNRVDANTYTVNIETMQLQFVFKKDEQGSLQIVSVVGIDGQSMPVKIVHWSQTPNKSMISALVSYDGPDTGKGLTAIYFKRHSSAKEIPMYSKVYRYLAGPGVGIRWNTDEALEINFCGDSKDLSDAQFGVFKWNMKLVNRLKINLKKVDRFAPFSDLNQHCIYPVNVYDNSPNENGLDLGATVTIFDMNSASIVDSDIIIFNKAFDRLRDAVKAKSLSESEIKSLMGRYIDITYAHELGHLLGLDHQFDGTPSIMSYKLDSLFPTEYDTNAIQALYPEK